jgi:hypothetical protein
MKNVMQLGSRRQVQAIRNIIHLLANLEWLIEHGAKLAPTFHIEGCHGAVHQTQPNPLPCLERHFSMLAIIDHLVVLL